MTNGATHVQRIVPSGLPEFTFYADNLPILTHTKTSRCENSLVTGQLNRFYDIQVSGNITLFAISFNPHGLAIFLDIPISEFYNQNIPLKYLLKDEFSELETKLYEAKFFSEKIFVAEQ